jgi:hypothetical protein
MIARACVLAREGGGARASGGLHWAACDCWAAACKRHVRGLAGPLAAAGLRRPQCKVGWAERVGERPRRRNSRGGCRLLYFGLKLKHAGKENGRRRKKRGFIFLKSLQTNEFKCKFEFKHTKLMHQHVCNIKLL